ncbi:MAG: diaminopimelate decarboxylase [Chloroflexota bacterium]|nr:diaminopimelate decarboxylase [Chloroflexota bacterium]
MKNVPKLSLFPLAAVVNDRGHLCIGGCDVIALAKEFGTPLYILDECTIRHRCREFKTEFSKYYPDTLAIYASKAFLNKSLALILKEEGLGLDVVSGGELYIAHSVDFPSDKIFFHGNNKTGEELELALSYGIGRVAVDNFYELELLDRMTKERGLKQDILLRLTPGVDPHTHEYTTTGTLDSKFGFPLATGQAEEAVKQAISASNLNLLGFHFHLGSPISETTPYELAIEIVLQFAQEVSLKHGIQLSELNIGGGFAVSYIEDSKLPTIAEYAQAISSKVKSVTSTLGLNSPRLMIEPGRAIVAQAGVALYTIGAIKEIPKVRKYVCVNGGMSDNIRPALYRSKYEALVANKVLENEKELVTIAGKLCESGDILVRDVNLALLSPGDIIAIPVCGAYSLPMSSNYNMLPRPAIVMVKEGKARLIRRRENYEDLTRLDT